MSEILKETNYSNAIKCDEITETSERYWSLEAAEADTEEGRVVTGARFVKKDKVFHLQIQQAKALPEG